MLLLSLFIALAVLSLFGMVLGFIYEKEEFEIGLLLPLLIFISVSIAIGVDGSYSEMTRYKNEMVKTHQMLEEKIEKFDNTYSFRLLNELYDDCQRMDARIEMNKRLYTSIWRGRNYSKEIGELELLVPKFEEKFKEK